MHDTEPNPDTAHAAGWPPPRRAWTMLAVLTLAYILSFVDRMVFGLLIGPIRDAFEINDTVFSLLYGWGFAFFYTVLGIPLGRAADRWNRRSLAAAGIALWSLMTAACGLARSFGELALARIAVGVGEATLSPAAYSMAGDSFPPTRLGRALSVFVVGWPLGVGLALVIGGMVIQAVSAGPGLDFPVLGPLDPWRACFVIVGLPGLLVALMVLALAEPTRRGGPAVARADHLGARRHFRRHWRPYASLTLGFSMLSIVMNTYQLWGVQFFVRQHAFTTAEAGLRVGLVIAVCGTLGVLAGGWLHDRLRARGHADAALLVGGVAALAMLPFTLTSTLAGDPALATLLMLPIGFFTTFGFGASGAALVLVTPPALRATASAVYLFVLNAIAMGMGPLLTAWLNDGVFHDDRAVGRSVALVASAAVLCAAALFRWGRPHFLALSDGAAIGAAAR